VRIRSASSPAEKNSLPMNSTSRTINARSGASDVVWANAPCLEPTASQTAEHIRQRNTVGRYLRAIEQSRWARRAIESLFLVEVEVVVCRRVVRPDFFDALVRLSIVFHLLDILDDLQRFASSSVQYIWDSAFSR